MKHVSSDTDSKRKKVKALDDLFAQSKTYRSSTEYLNLLTFINKFPYLSPFNAFLIHMQNKGVNIVLSAEKWKNHNRVPKHNSRPLIILVPFGPVDFVYDINDTESTTSDIVPDLARSLFYTAGAISINVFERLLASLRKQGLQYEEYIMNKGSAGYAEARSTRLKIAVNSTLSVEEKFSTLVHELAHVFCGHLGTHPNLWCHDRSVLSKTVKEVEAESVSFLVCERFGLKTSSAAYLTNYVQDNAEMVGISLDTILVAAGYIEAMTSNSFRPKYGNRLKSQQPALFPEV